MGWMTLDDVVWYRPSEPHSLSSNCARRHTSLGDVSSTLKRRSAYLSMFRFQYNQSREARSSTGIFWHLFVDAPAHTPGSTLAIHAQNVSHVYGPVK